MSRKIKAFSIASTIGMVTAAVIIALSCVLPLRMIKELKEEIAPLAGKAVVLVLEERHEEAERTIDSICGKLAEKRNALMMLFGHDEIEELMYAANTAYELAKADDTSQLITELTNIINKCEFLLYSNDAGFENIF